MLTLVVSVRASADTDPFRYELGATFTTNEPKSSYIVDPGNYAFVTVTVNATCRVHNDDHDIAKYGEWNTSCQGFLLNDSTIPPGVVISASHTTSTKVTSYVDPEDYIDLNTDTCTGSNDVLAGSIYYHAEGWIAVENSWVSPNII